jgi:hypothetical protein
VATRNGFILKKTVTAFVTNGAVMGVVQHKPFNDIFAKRHSLFICGGYHHAFHSIHHTAHLHASDGTLHKLYGTHPAGTHRSQGLMIAKARDHDPQQLSGIDDLGPRRDFDFKIVYDQFGHPSSSFHSSEGTEQRAKSMVSSQ